MFDFFKPGRKRLREEVNSAYFAVIDTSKKSFQTILNKEGFSLDDYEDLCNILYTLDNIPKEKIYKNDLSEAYDVFLTQLRTKISKLDIAAMTDSEDFEYITELINEIGERIGKLENFK